MCLIKNREKQHANKDAGWAAGTRHAGKLCNWRNGLECPEIKEKTKKKRWGGQNGWCEQVSHFYKPNFRMLGLWAGHAGGVLEAWTSRKGAGWILYLVLIFLLWSCFLLDRIGWSFFGPGTHHLGLAEGEVQSYLVAVEFAAFPSLHCISLLMPPPFFQFQSVVIGLSAMWDTAKIGMFLFNINIGSLNVHKTVVWDIISLLRILICTSAPLTN